jgi:hypothetical protein
MTYVLRVSMSMNSSGGFQKLDDVCQLTIENKRYKISIRFLDSSHNMKYCSFRFNNLSQN